MSRTRSAVNPHSIVAWMSRNSLIEAGAIFEDLVTVTGLDWPILLYGWVIVHKLSGCGFESVAVAKIVTFGEILRALFSCNHFFEIRPFTVLPTNKSSRFQNNTWCSLWVFWEKSITNKPHISTVFLFFVYLSTFLILLNLFYANNTFPYVPKRLENYRFSGVFRGWINGTLAWNELTMENGWNLNVRHSINRSVFYSKQ